MHHVLPDSPLSIYLASYLVPHRLQGRRTLIGSSNTKDLSSLMSSNETRFSGSRGQITLQRHCSLAYWSCDPIPLSPADRRPLFCFLPGCCRGFQTRGGNSGELLPPSGWETSKAKKKKKKIEQGFPKLTWMLNLMMEKNAISMLLEW